MAKQAEKREKLLSSARVVLQLRSASLHASRGGKKDLERGPRAWLEWRAGERKGRAPLLFTEGN